MEDENSTSNCAQDQKPEELVEQLTSQLEKLEAEYADLQYQSEIKNLERELLNLELATLREGLASRTDESLWNQLKQKTNELYNTRDKLDEMFEETTRLEYFHRDQTKRMQEQIKEVVEAHNNLKEEYNNLVQEHQRLVQIDEEKDKQICGFEVWKMNQIEADRQMLEKTRHLEDHIQEMLIHQDCLLKQLEETRNSNTTGEPSIQNSQINMACNNCSTAIESRRRQSCPSSANSDGDQTITKVIANIREAARRITQ